MAGEMQDSPVGEDKLSIEMLGAGQEVGRSCCVIRFKGACATSPQALPLCVTREVRSPADPVHPAYTGLSALPFIDNLDWSTVDALLITQYVSTLMQFPSGPCCCVDLRDGKDQLSRR